MRNSLLRLTCGVVIVLSSILAVTGVAGAVDRHYWGGGCVSDSWHSTSQDRAWHERVTLDSCSMWVRNYYTSGGNKIGPWHTNYSSYVVSSATPQLYTHQAGISNN